MPPSAEVPLILRAADGSTLMRSPRFVLPALPRRGDGLPSITGQYAATCEEGGHISHPARTPVPVRFQKSQRCLHQPAPDLAAACSSRILAHKGASRACATGGRSLIIDLNSQAVMANVRKTVASGANSRGARLPVEEGNLAEVVAGSQSSAGPPADFNICGPSQHKVERDAAAALRDDLFAGLMIHLAPGPRDPLTIATRQTREQIHSSQALDNGRFGHNASLGSAFKRRADAHCRPPAVPQSRRAGHKRRGIRLHCTRHKPHGLGRTYACFLAAATGR